MNASDSPPNLSAAINAALAQKMKELRDNMIVGAGILALVLWFANPSADRHYSAAAEYIKKTYPFRSAFIDAKAFASQHIYHSWLLFSYICDPNTGTIDSFGMLWMVWIKPDS